MEMINANCLQQMIMSSVNSQQIPVKETKQALEIILVHVQKYVNVKQIHSHLHVKKEVVAQHVIQANNKLNHVVSTMLEYVNLEIKQEVVMITHVTSETLENV